MVGSNIPCGIAVERRIEISNYAHGKFKSLAFMNRHNMHNVCGFRNVCSGFKVAVFALNSVDETNKARKSALTRVFVFLCVVNKHAEICFAL